MPTPQQKKELRRLLVKSSPTKDDDIVEMYENLEGKIPSYFQSAIQPHNKNIEILKDVLLDVPNEIDKKITKSERKTNSSFEKLAINVSKELENKERSLLREMDKVNKDLNEEKVKIVVIKDDVIILKKEVKDLWWTRGQEQHGKAVFLSSLIDVNINNPVANQTLQYINGKWTNSTASGGTFYTETVSGLINSVNKTFTVATNINTAFALYLANSVYQPNVDFTYSGTTITMIVAPDISLAGQPFWLLHN